ncbi:MAG: hypothetical protein J6M19_01500 [Bacteroidaceae bacterium]|nr:hypothetical protein [Bacteroidaceae bacterium]
MKTIYQYLFLGAFLGMAGTAMAQDSYDAQTFANSDLNGTSRFVAMGGALGALGGDVSVMSTNPAGTAMYRKSDAAITLSGLFTNDKAMGHSKSRMSFDQGGALIAFDMDNPTGKGLQFINFGINYQKNRNYLSNLTKDINNLGGVFSQTYQIADLCNYALENDYWGTLADMSASRKDVHGGILNETKESGRDYEGVGADRAYYERATYGANIQADLNVSFNVSDQFFFGASLGVYDIDYERESFYQEFGNDGNNYDFTNWYKTTGDGFDVKLGFICRPIEDSPFRFGVNVHTPTWYRMTDSNGSTLYLNDEYVTSGSNSEYDYHFRTPWKFGFSLGHTIGTNFAIGAEYEFQDLSTAKYSDVDHRENYYFRNVNQITDQTLRGQHTLKVGVEYKPIDELSLRAGYNFVSSPFKKDAFRTIGYDGPYTETDYTNWGAVNRFTIGLGYRYKGGYFDIAWQYQAQKGDFYAFDDIDLKPTKIKNNRSQLMATLGFRF